EFNALWVTLGSSLWALSSQSARAATRMVKLPDGTIVPALGQGSAGLGLGRRPKAAEEEALRTGLSLGMNLIDTAESYGGGGSEKLIGGAITGQGDRCATNQVPYNLGNRGIEQDLLPWCERHGMPAMAYSPLGGAGSSVLRDPTLARIGAAHNCSAAAVALTWTIRNGNVIAIPE